jgi:diguanylate cyclase (GGDEF)-like protein
MASRLRIALISHDQSLANRLEIRLQSKGFQVISLARHASVLGFIYSDPPDLVIADLATGGEETVAVIRELKQDSSFGVIPVIGILAPSSDEGHEWSNLPLDDFVTQPAHFGELLSRIALSQQRLLRIFDNNPLTRLPGNTSIQHAIEKALGKHMAVCYIDINNFKPYNDTYGFSRGDDVIRMVARITANAVRESGDEGFVGHVGGDDFVFIVPFEKAENICKMIISNFTVIASELFGEEEKARGYYVARDRKEQEQRIPLLGVAIAVVPTDTPQMTHAGRVAEVAAELKKFAKKSSTSTYAIDRRRERK